MMIKCRPTSVAGVADEEWPPRLSVLAWRKVTSAAFVMIAGAERYTSGSATQGQEARMRNMAHHWRATVALVATAGSGFLSAPLLAQEPRPVAIVGLDYAFQGRDTIPAGPAIFSFVNQGAVRHEMVIYILNEGRTLADYLRAATAQERQGLGRAVGLILAEPGQPALARMVVNLAKEKSYVLLCNLRDAPDKPQHNTLGMGKALIVR